MKFKGLYILFIVLFVMSLFLMNPTQVAFAADCNGDAGTQFRSAGNGNWTNASTWECSDDGINWEVPDTQYPTSANSDITIRNSHTVTAITAITVDQVHVESGGQITVQIPGPSAFTLADGSGNDLIIDGTVLMEGRLRFGTGNPTWKINDGGVYIHHVQDNAVSVTQRMTADPDSTFIYRMGSTIDVDVATARTYGNLYLESTSGSWIADTPVNTTTMTIAGDFVIGSNVDFRPEFYGVQLIGGDFINNGTLTDGAGSLIYRFTGSGNTIGGDSPSEFEDLEFTAGASITVNQEITATGTLTNSGEIRRTKAVNGNSNVSFFDTGGYGGVILNANNADLGDTTVTIRGNQDCTSESNETIQRCFDIEPANSTGRNATITFFFDSSEVVGTNACSTLEVYGYAESGWGSTPLTRDTSYGTDGRMCGSDPQSIRVVGVSDFSPFLTKSGAAPYTDMVSVTKTADPTTVLEPGGTVSYTVEIENSSLVYSVTVDSVLDDQFGDIASTCDSALPVDLDPEVVVTCEFTQTISGAVGFEHVNIATASGSDHNGYEISESGGVTVTVVNATPSILVTKTATPETLSEPGGSVSFEVDIENTSGATDPVTIDTLNDDIYGDLTDITTEGGTAKVQSDTDCSLPQTIQSGTSYTCTFTATVSGNPGYSETNEVTASGTDDDDAPVSDSDSATVTIEDVASSILVNKTASPLIVSEPGNDVAFTVTVTNTSAVDTVTITTVNDDIFGDISADCDQTLPADLAPGEGFTCAFTEYVGGNAGDTHTNEVTASGTDDDDDPVSDSDSATVTIEDVASSILVSKTASLLTVFEPGNDVTFTVMVTNTSAADTVTITTVNDDIFGDISADCDQTLPADLAPGEGFTCAFTEYVGGNAGDTHTNEVTASGTDDDDDPVSDSDSATVTIEDVASSILVSKTASLLTVFEPGNDVTFTVMVTNTSAADTVTITTVNDDIFGDISADCDQTLPADLAPGEVLTCSFTEYIGGDLGDTHTNEVTVSGTDDDGNPVSGSDSATVNVFTGIFFPIILSSSQTSSLGNKP